MVYITVQPAYGRDYKSQAEVMADYNADKDFQIVDITSPDYGRYINRPQVTSGMTLNVRYAKGSKVLPIVGKNR